MKRWRNSHTFWVGRAEVLHRGPRPIVADAPHTPQGQLLHACGRHLSMHCGGQPAATLAKSLCANCCALSLCFAMMHLAQPVFCPSWRLRCSLDRKHRPAVTPHHRCLSGLTNTPVHRISPCRRAGVGPRRARRLLRQPNQPTECRRAPPQRAPRWGPGGCDTPPRDSRPLPRGPRLCAVIPAVCPLGGMA